MNIELLQGTYEVAENPGLDTLDPRFAEITSLVTTGDYATAAQQAEAITSEKIYDIRLIGYILFGHFLQEGVAGLQDVFAVLKSVVGENWAAIGPVKNKEKNAKNALLWFTKQLLKKLNYEEEKQGAGWQTWTSTVDSELAQEIVELIEGFHRACGPPLDEQAKPVMDSVKKIDTWMRSFAKAVYQEPEPEEEVYEEEEEVFEEEEEEIAPQGAPQAAPMAAPQMVTGTAFSGNMPVVEGSIHLVELLKKMAAFEELINDEKFIHAALVADDINATIENFDPRLFFPSLFKNYSKLFAVSINELAEAEDARETLAWKAMESFFHVDIDEFVKS